MKQKDPFKRLMYLGMDTHDTEVSEFVLRYVNGHENKAWVRYVLTQRRRKLKDSLKDTEKALSLISQCPRRTTAKQ
jgi:hypothetical protein